MSRIKNQTIILPHHLDHHPHPQVDSHHHCLLLLFVTISHYPVIKIYKQVNQWGHTNSSENEYFHPRITSSWHPNALVYKYLLFT